MSKDIRAGIYSLLLALASGYLYAQIARKAGLPSGLIGLTAILAQVARIFAGWL